MFKVIGRKERKISTREKKEDVNKNKKKEFVKKIPKKKPLKTSAVVITVRDENIILRSTCMGQIKCQIK